MCCSTAAKITFNLYVMQPECYVWYEIRKDAVCSWVLDRELMTCPSSEPSDMIASMPHLPFPTLFPLLTKWLACKVTAVTLVATWLKNLSRGVSHVVSGMAAASWIMLSAQRTDEGVSPQLICTPRTRCDMVVLPLCRLHPGLQQGCWWL